MCSSTKILFFCLFNENLWTFFFEAWDFWFACYEILWCWFTFLFPAKSAKHQSPVAWQPEWLFVPIIHCTCVTAYTIYCVNMLLCIHVTVCTCVTVYCMYVTVYTCFCVYMLLRIHVTVYSCYCLYIGWWLVGCFMASFHIWFLLHCSPATNTLHQI